jgi:acyl-CoA thioesterase I
MRPAACAVALAAVFFGCGQEPKQNSAPPATLSAPFASPAPIADSRSVIAVFGDSLTAGFGLDPGQSFPDRLQKVLDDAGYHYRVANLGVSGDTTTDGVERIPSVLAVHPSVVIVEFGANDGLRGLPVASARQNLAKIVGTLRDAKVRVLLAGMTLPRNYGPEYIRPFEQMYVDVAAKYGVARIPFLLEGVGGNPHLTQPDGLHPTAQGAEIIAHTVLKYLAPMLQK